MYSEMSWSTFFGGGELSGQLNIDVGFLCSGRREGSDPRGESLRKKIVPGLPPAEINQICSNVDTSTDFKSVDFSHQKKNRQMSRQTVNRFGFLGHPNTLAARGLEELRVILLFKENSYVT
jgi:hypothetical protein